MLLICICPLHAAHTHSGVGRFRYDPCAHVLWMTRDRALQNNQYTAMEAVTQGPAAASSVSTRRGFNAGLMLGQRRRRWPNIKPALNPRRVFTASPTRTCSIYVGLISLTLARHCRSEGCRSPACIGFYLVCSGKDNGAIHDRHRCILKGTLTFTFPKYNPTRPNISNTFNVPLHLNTWNKVQSRPFQSFIDTEYKLPTLCFSPDKYVDGKVSR